MAEGGDDYLEERSVHSLKNTNDMDALGSSAFIIDIDVLYRFNYLANEFRSDARDDPLRFSEGTLQSAQGHSCLLGGYSGEQLRERSDQRSPPKTGARRRIIPRPMLGGRQSPRAWYPATPIRRARSVLRDRQSPRRNHRTRRKAPSGP